MRSFFLSVLAYGGAALALFGDVLAPVGFATTFSDRLGAPFWPLFVCVSLVAAGVIARLLPVRDVSFRIPIFIVLWISLSLVSVGIYAEWIRHRKVNEFQPDAYIGNSFFRSVREAPREFQFFLHAAALKNCKPYAWSYREMAFYELHANTAVNVLPNEWLKRCAIKRTS